MNIYIISKEDRCVYALQHENGNILWQHTFDQDLTGALSAASNTVLVGAKGFVYVLHARNGTLLWEHPIPDDAPQPSTLIDARTAYISTRYAIYALDMNDGSQRWQCTNLGHGAIAKVADGVIYIFFPEGLYALNASDGTIIWHDPVFHFTPSYLAVNNGKVFVPSNKTDLLHILQASDGTHLGILPGRTMISADGILYIHEENNGIYAVDPKKQTILWRNPDMEANLTAAGDSTLYSLISVLEQLPSSTSSQYEFGHGHTYVYALNASDGALRWQWSIPHAIGISSHPVIKAGNIYFSTYGGMYAMRGSDGTLLWNVLQDKFLSSDPKAA